ncbi:MAG TPA: four helix bundle protein [Candidatus Acetothermia bacterium]|nr:four helix bundle protein [Candidatus Acetothermia bacterium]
MKTHKNLDVWKRSMDLVQMVYTVTKKFPQDELYGLTNQLRRAAVSIPSNIAEGAARLVVAMVQVNWNR